MEIIDNRATLRRPISTVLKEWGMAHRFAGSKDRSAIGNLVYDAERRRASHAWRMGEDTCRALVLSVLVNDWGLDVAALNQAFSDDRFAPEQISQEELARLENLSALDDAPDYVLAELPEWILPSFQKVFPDTWQDEGQGLAMRPPLDLRVNGLSSTTVRVHKSLKRFDPQPIDYLPGALRIPSGTGDVRTPNVQADEAYQKGWVEIQDLGSQIVATLAAAKPGEQVLDFCAGGGGKTLALASAMQNKGQLFAHDADYHRLAPIYERLKRNNVRNCQVRKPESGSLDDLEASMDLVLVDAPCTGTGTWRRHPDTKWRLSEDQLTQRVNQQRQVLRDAARYVKPGGRMAYITCSLLPQENDEQIESFIKENRIFSRVAPETIWAGKIDATPRRFYLSPYGLTLTPQRSQTDGFYISVLHKSN